MALGEAGYVEKTDLGQIEQKPSKSKEIQTITSIFSNADNYECSACLLWNIDFFQHGNRPDLLDLIKEYKDKNNSI